MIINELNNDLTAFLGVAVIILTMAVGVAFSILKNRITTN
jgi:hypothetical protein